MSAIMRPQIGRLKLAPRVSNHPHGVDVGKAVLTGICFEGYAFTVLDAVGLSVKTVVLAQTAV